MSTLTRAIKSKAVVLHKSGFAEHSSKGKFAIESFSKVLVDDASFNVTPRGPGILYLHDGAAEGGMFGFLLDATIWKAGSSTNVANTDSDTDLCAFDGGAFITVKNRLGGNRTVTGFFVYHTA